MWAWRLDWVYRTDLQTFDVAFAPAELNGSGSPVRGRCLCLKYNIAKTVALST